MSAAKKLPSAPTTSADLEAQRDAAERAVRDAETALQKAEADLASAPRDPQQRLVARESVNLANEDLVAARESLERARCSCHEAKRSEDMSSATLRGSRVSRAAQLRKQKQLSDRFLTHVVGAVRDFFEASVTERVAFSLEAKELEVICKRLGDFSVAGVDFERGSGKVNLDNLDGLTGIRARLQELLDKHTLASDPVGRAAVMFLQSAFDAEQQTQRVGRALAAEVLERTKKGGTA